MAKACPVAWKVGKPCQENFPVTRPDTLPDTHNPVAHSRLTGKVTECQEILKKLFCRKLPEETNAGSRETEKYFLSL